MMKKLLSTIVLMLLPMLASAYDFTYNGIRYTIVSKAEQTLEVAASNQTAGEDGPTLYKGDITIPSTITYGGKDYKVIGIGYHAFVNCVGVNSVSLPNTLTYIRKEAFECCLGLRKITIPKNVVSIEYDIFAVTLISEITVLNPVPASVSYSAFLYPQNYNNCVLYVPYGCSDAYRNAKEWKNFKTIIELEKEPDNIDGHQYVDLGLPSGKCWATTNYGSETPEGYGSYLEWGYNNVISSNWGSEWTTPSLEDIRELETNCSWIWSSKNGHNGYIITGKNGNSIFLPASGYMMMGQSTAGNVGNWAYYWTSTQSGEMAYIIMSTSSSVWYGEMNTSFTKLPIRPVTKDCHAEPIEQTNDRGAVDLGLPSGLLWATTNVGAKHPEEYGLYFAWAETSPKTDYSWATYKYANGSKTSLTKYCTSTSYGTVDFLETLETQDDAATTNWGKPWRTPTLSETQELINYCKWSLTSRNGVSGYSVTGPNGNSIFIPSGGVNQYGIIYYNDAACVQTATLFNASNGKPSSASILFCESGAPHYWYGWDRCWGYNVRPVTNYAPSYVSAPIDDDESGEIVGIYDLQGHKLKSRIKGVNILKYKNGSTKKVVR
jgi:hypothetical protein